MRTILNFATEAILLAWELAKALWATAVVGTKGGR
jgi:hypothetical protein